MKKVLLYYPYELGDLSSGSGVRPLKMLQAFREYTANSGLELIEIHGESNKRKKKIKDFEYNINPNDVIFCYMENSTLPFWLTDKDHIPRNPLLEINFFGYLKKHNIPLGLFYRDIYWRFDDEYPLKGYKRSIMRNIYRLEHSIYTKYVTHFFLPSIEMNKYVQFPTHRTSSLPPGGEDLLEYRKNTLSEELNIIYVGGISKSYGLTDMFQAIEKVHQDNLNVKLHLICREDEFKRHKNVFSKEKPWLHVYHAHGDQLKEIYNIADVAIIPRRKNIYNDFAVPVKLFEYISYGLPIIATDCNAQANIVHKYQLGVVVEDGASGIQKGIEFFFNKLNQGNYSRQVKSALLKEHLWIHRVEEIESILRK